LSPTPRSRGGMQMDVWKKCESLLCWKFCPPPFQLQTFGPASETPPPPPDSVFKKPLKSVKIMLEPPSIAKEGCKWMLAGMRLYNFLTIWAPTPQQLRGLANECGRYEVVQFCFHKLSLPLTNSWIRPWGSPYLSEIQLVRNLTSLKL
jgi:hypothetical protein